jgi:hypothetical protein
MVFLWLYRQFKAKKKASTDPQNGGDQPVSPKEGQNEAAAPTPSPAAEVPANGSQQGTVRWRVMLMLALLFPIFLETLDYTGLVFLVNHTV